MLQELARTYRAHLDIVMQRASQALEAVGADTLIIAAGGEKLQFLDDLPYTFKTNPHFKAWLPLTAHPHCWIMFTPGDPPILIYHQPEDFWVVPPAEPQGYWLDLFDLVVIRQPEHVARHLPHDKSNVAVIGEDVAALQALGFQHINPPKLLDVLHWHRARKTAYELVNMRIASQRAARGHLAAEKAFRAGASEIEILRSYCAGAGHTESELPYQSIIALNDNASVLHYQLLGRQAPTRLHSFLIDAGGSCQGYAADVSRTYAAEGADEFQSLIQSMDEAQRGLVRQCRAGVDFRDLHLQAHLAVARVLAAARLISCTPEAAVETGLSARFFPHGLGHLLGLQVHDVGGFMAGPDGGEIVKPDGHPYLRLTRTLEPGMVVTIEPGLYFIDMLLRDIKRGESGDVVQWSRVRELRKFGGIRVEDDVLITDDEPENLTRDAFIAVAG